MLNDFLLFGKIKDGDIKAFETLFRLYHAPLCLYASGITGRRDVAEDIVQDVFYLIWKTRATMQIHRSVKSYLYGAVKNQSFLYLEHMQIREQYEARILNGGTDTAAGPDPHEQMEYAELEAVVERTLAGLPERRQRIFHMHRMEGQKYSEIAERLAISVKTVEAEMAKACRQLRHNVEKYYKNIS
ncbi:MAG: RNA polymerase sigma-70 factor [Tannerella sp.]|jgi:RNA polymerase sigma-70 factor (ECF subfamily)|nr:RNA polymerase sigma-70 factor [Tannerella sp.]